MNDSDKARERIASIVVLLKVAVEHVRADGATPGLAIVGRHASGGRVIAMFDCDEFFQDMEELFPVDKDELILARSAALLARSGVKGDEPAKA